MNEGSERKGKRKKGKEKGRERERKGKRKEGKLMILLNSSAIHSRDSRSINLFCSFSVS